jgi:hypothetical protein
MKTLMRKIKNTGQRGQSMVEFSLTMVILLVLLVGIVDVGRALFTYMALRDAAQEGAIFGSTHPGSIFEPEMKARVRISSTMMNDIFSAACGGLPSECPNIVISYINPGGGAKTSNICMGDGVTVRVNYPRFPITMPFLGAIIGQQYIPISATITDTVLRPPCQ